MLFPCPFQSYLVFGGPTLPVFQPNSCEPPGPLPGSQLPLLGEFFEIPGLAIPSGYANISRFAELAKWLHPRQSCENLTATTPRWGKLPRGSWCMEPVLLPIERLLRVVKEKKMW